MRVAVLSGGRSSEHEISLVSGAAVAVGLREAGHEVLEVTLDREGGWSFDQLNLGERPEPVPQAGEVLIRMHAASLNARDRIVPLRGYGRATGELPLIPVSDGVGTVIAIGPGVSRVKPGDRVCPTYFQGWISGEPSAERFATALGGPLDGVMADLVCLSEDGVVRVPDYLTHEEAATLPCAAVTAWPRYQAITSCPGWSAGSSDSEAP